MTPEYIDRSRIKFEMRETVRTAQVNPKLMTALYLGICGALNMADVFAGGNGILGIFVSVMVTLVTVVLGAGYTMYAMAIVRGERAEYLSLFDGFSLAGKIILLYIVKTALVAMWSMLFMFPGIVASYRYRFAEMNLYENPDLGVFEAINLSKRQTMGYKKQLFLLDLSFLGWSALAIAPLLLENTLYSIQLTAAQFGMAMDTFLFTLLAENYAVWVGVSSLWQMVVSMFYLPHYHTCVVGYYEAAKSTSQLDPCQFRRFDETPDGL